MSWLGEIDTTTLWMDVDAKKRLQSIRFCNDVTIGLEIILELLDKVMMTGRDGKIIHVNTEDNKLCWRDALEE